MMDGASAAGVNTGVYSSASMWSSIFGQDLLMDDDVGQSCDGGAGTCIDTSVTQCSGTLIPGDCPGAPRGLAAATAAAAACTPPPLPPSPLA